MQPREITRNSHPVLGRRTTNGILSGQPRRSRLWQEAIARNPRKPTELRLAIKRAEERAFANPSRFAQADNFADNFRGYSTFLAIDPKNATHAVLDALRRFDREAVEAGLRAAGLYRQPALRHLRVAEPAPPTRRRRAKT